MHFLPWPVASLHRVDDRRPLLGWDWSLAVGQGCTVLQEEPGLWSSYLLLETAAFVQ